MKVLHPVVVDDDNNPLPFRWVTLPNGEPGHFLSMFDETGEFTEDDSKAHIVCALDRFIKEWQFLVTPNTFERPMFQ